MESAPIRVLLVDDHAVVRSGLAGFLRAFDDLQLAGEASNGEEAVRMCEQVEPDVVLMDLVMPGMDGAAATRAIRQHCPDVQVIALTSFKEKELVQRALEAGAIGYLLKSVSMEELVDAIRAAYAGRPTLSQEVAQALAQAEKLEQLARAILDAPPDVSILPALLLENLPGMLPYCHVEVRIFPDHILMHYPADWSLASEPIWEWMRSTSKTSAFLPGAALPWGGSPSADEGQLAAPILDVESTRPVGGIYLARRRDPESVSDLLPVVRSLAVQIASVLRSAEVHAHAEADQKVARELTMAGQIQASFLPNELPDLAGWQLAAALEPAREISGDFYDFIPLSDGRLGIVIADVADKGMGAALYMALSYSLIRTYAAEHDTRPDLVLSAANRRILSDTRAGLFVTVFYGILDPVSGTLTYGSAGHNPPYLLSARNGGSVHVLHRTGMALGVLADETWQQDVVQLAPGDMLVLYTDGVTEAQDSREVLFGPERLLKAAQAAMGSSAPDALDALMTAVHKFAGDAPLAGRDDIALVVLVRDV